MNCVFCGEEISGRPIRQGGQIYCSMECLDTAVEVGSNEDDYEDDDVQDDGLDLDYFDEADEF